MKQFKIVIIGAGHVGSHCGYSLMQYGDVDEIVYIDVEAEKAAAQAADIADAGIFMPHPVKVRSGDYKDCDDADVVVLAAGVPRKEGQTRLDTLGDSIVCMQDIAPKLKATQFNGPLVCISNPADVIADFMYRSLGWDSASVFSTGTALDTARCKRAFKEALDIDARSIDCYVLGEHGDSSMIPFSTVRIGGQALRAMKGARYTALDEAAILNRTHMIGMEIVIGKGSTEFGIGTVLANVVRAIVHDSHAVMPVSARLHGEYGHSDLHIGVPAIIGRKGVMEIIEMPLTEAEQESFDRSCEIVLKHNKMAQSI
ncbi:MAG: L-lactate dehydrogenase [Clostridiales bacterium]|nr:L-lactate dehydrogenase [Clostridiales bacterium]